MANSAWSRREVTALLATAVAGFSLRPALADAQWKVSDHFDGTHFYNPTLPKGFSPAISDGLRMTLGPRASWPDFVENTAIPQLNEKLDGRDVAITFVGHATFLIQLPGLTILTDPIWSKRAGPLSWLGVARVRDPGIRFDDLPNIDVVLISHNHYDHLDIHTLQRLRERCSPKVIVPAGDGKLGQSLGFREVYELDWWDSVQLAQGMSVTFAPTQHFSGRGPFGRQESLWGAYMVTSRNGSIYFGGDSGYSSHFSETRRRLGSSEVALLGIGGYEPRSFMAPIHMNPAEAVRAHKDLGAKRSIGMHFGTFRLSAESINQPKRDLASALSAERLAEERFITMQEGETRIYRLKGPARIKAPPQGAARRGG